MPADDVLRIANCSGFYGDRLAAAREMVEGGPIDVLTGDYLAELTLMILFRDRLKSPGAGYARTFLRQMEEVLGTCVARGIKIVANAGGLNPAGLAAEVEQLATRLGVRARIAHVEGDDLLPRLADLQARGVPDIARIGFPIAEMHADGSFVVTKHPGTGGLVSVGTVTAQLLYEIQGPRYLNPDATARFDSIRLEQAGPDRVRVSGVRGEPPPPTTKVCINYLGGYRNSMTFVLAGLDVEAKAETAEQTLWALLGGRERFAATDVQLVRSDRPDPRSNDEAFAYLRVTVKDPDAARVGRAFSNKAVEMALANYPGFFITSPPGDA